MKREKSEREESKLKKMTMQLLSNLTNDDFTSKLEIFQINRNQFKKHSSLKNK